MDVGLAGSCLSGAVSCFSGSVSSSAISSASHRPPVGIVGAAAGEVMNHFHTQTRKPRAHLVTAALTSSHGHRWKWLLQLVSAMSS